MFYADLVLHGGKVATVDRRFSFVEAVAVKDGWIVDVGASADIRGYVGPDTRVVDLRGRVLLPGANDAHMHAVHTGLKMGPGILDVGFPAVKSVRDIQDLIAGAVKASPPGAWIYGMGWMGAMLEECAAEGRGLTRHDLDPVSPNNPVMLNDFGLHNLVVNSRALEIAGMDRNFRELRPEEGYVFRDPDGELNGCFLEWGAQQMLTRFGPLLNDEEIEQCILRAQTALNRVGITSHTDILGVGGDKLICGSWGSRAIEVYERMAREGNLSARVSINLFAAIDGIMSYESVVQALETQKLPTFSNPSWVKADVIKLFGDGAAWYRSGEGRSVFPGDTVEQQREQMRKTILEVHRRGWQIGIHAIGGMTIDTAVDAFAEAQRLYPRQAPRHFVIHADDISDANLETMAKYHILCSPQPVAGNMVAGFMAQTIGEELFHWQKYGDRGVVVTGGSDSSCFSFNWLEGVQFAVTRTTAMGQSVRPDLGMSVEDAVRMYTINGAVQEHMENLRGSIEIGKLADLQVLGADIFEVPKNEIGQIPVEMTICGGEVVFEA